MPLFFTLQTPAKPPARPGRKGRSPKPRAVSANPRKWPRLSCFWPRTKPALLPVTLYMSTTVGTRKDRNFYPPAASGHPVCWLASSRTYSSNRKPEVRAWSRRYTGASPHCRHSETQLKHLLQAPTSYRNLETGAVNSLPTAFRCLSSIEAVG